MLAYSIFSIGAANGNAKSDTAQLRGKLPRIVQHHPMDFVSATVHASFGAKKGGDRAFHALAAVTQPKLDKHRPVSCNLDVLRRDTMPGRGDIENKQASGFEGLENTARHLGSGSTVQQIVESLTHRKNCGATPAKPSLT